MKIKVGMRIFQSENFVVIHFIPHVVSFRTATEMANLNSNQSTERSKNFNFTVNKISSEPTSIPTRRDHIRKLLCNQFAEVMNDKFAPEPVDDSKHLQGTQIVRDSASYVKCRENYPLQRCMHGGDATDFSCWSAYAHPGRGYRRTYEFTKSDREYFGNSQWR